jgi:hypothetical protein
MISLFASRKISLTAMIDDIQFQMNLLSQKRMNLASVGMILADGQVSPDEIQQSNYYVQNGLAGAINLGNALSQQSAMMGQPMQMVYRNQMNPNIISFNSYAKEQAEAQLAAQEKVIDLQQKQLETKLSMYERELESVEKGEEKAIDRATPKYA